jgi:hypothetical protein
MKRLALVGVSLVVSMLVAELLARRMRIDDRLMAGAFLLQGADTPVHQVSADPVLHYEFKPDSHCQCAAPESPRPPYRVTIDQFGARYPTHAHDKASGVFRILMFGGSTLYGAAVNDEETVPAALERRLNQSSAGAGAAAPTRFEVWNFGTSGYTLLQAAHLARRQLAALDPDLILIHLHNRGPRGFFLPSGGDVRDVCASYGDDPNFVDEQFPPPAWLPAAVHRVAFAHSAIYRAGAGLLQHYRRSHSPFAHIEFSDALDRHEAEALDREAAARGVPVYFVDLPPVPGIGHDDVLPGFAAARFLSVDRPGRPPQFYETHPDPSVLDDYAAQLVDELRGPIATAAHRQPVSPP